jgi:hypothetical protein
MEGSHLFHFRGYWFQDDQLIKEARNFNQKYQCHLKDAILAYKSQEGFKKKYDINLGLIHPPSQRQSMLNYLAKSFKYGQLNIPANSRQYLQMDKNSFHLAS